MTSPLPNLDDQAVNQVFDRLVSLAMQTGKFDTVNQHEPKNAPGNGVTCSVWVQTVKPARKSGLSSTSIVVNFDMRIYKAFVSQPFDMIDPTIVSGAMVIMAALSGDFDFGGIADARAIDLLGMESGGGLSATAGYVDIDRRMYRVITINVPVIFNDAFDQEP